MNREIIFRGKRIDNEEWVEIEIFKGRKGFEEWTDGLGPVTSFVDTSTGNSKKWCRANVDPGTIGQYTGLRDSTGKRIFEGDILEFEDLGEEGYEYKEGFDFINTASVVFNNGRFKLENFGSDNSGVLEEMNDDHEDFIDVFAYSTIIGNRWDNPELLVAE